MSNSNNKNAKNPSKKKRKVTVHNINSIDSFIAEMDNTVIKGTIMHWSMEKVTEKGMKYVNLTLIYFEKDNNNAIIRHTMTFRLTGDNFAKFKMHLKIKRGTFAQIETSKIKQYETANGAVTSVYWGIIGKDKKHKAIKEIKSGINKFNETITNPSMEEFNLLQHGDDINICGIVLTETFTKEVEKWNKKQQIRSWIVNINNQWEVKIEAFNFPVNNFCTYDIIIVWGKVNKYRNKNSIKIIDYLVNYSNDQSKQLKSVKEKHLKKHKKFNALPTPQFDDTHLYTDVEHESLEKWVRYKNLRKDDHLNIHALGFNEKNYKLIKLQAKHLNHTSNTSFYATRLGGNGKKLQLTKNGYIDNDANIIKPIHIRQRITLKVYIRNDLTVKGNGLMVTFFSEAAELLLGVSADKYNEMSKDEKVTLWNENIIDNCYELLLKVEAKTWQETNYLEFVCQGIKQIVEDDFISLTDNETDSESASASEIESESENENEIQTEKDEDYDENEDEENEIDDDESEESAHDKIN